MKIYIEVDDRIVLFDRDEPVVSVGRGSDNVLVVKDPRASRQHCRVLKTPHGMFLEDLGSRNGTLVNGSKIEKCPIQEGDVFQIGKTHFYVERLPPEKETFLSVDRPESSPGASSDQSDTLATQVRPVAPPAEEPLQLDESDLILDGGGEVAAPAGEPPLTTDDAYLEGLKGLHAGRRVPITKLPYKIGRKADNDFRLEDPRTSAHHAKIFRRDRTFFLEDLDSKNGTFINGKRVEGEIALQAGMRLQIGECQYRIHLPGGSEPGASLAAGVGEAGSEYEFSRFNVDEFLRESERSGHPLVAIGIVLILGAILYFAVDIAVKVAARRNPDPPILSNLLLENWSFEEAAGETGEIEAWSVADGDEAALEIVEGRGAKYPGRRALALQAASGGQEMVRAVYSSPLSVTGDSRYFLSANVLNAGSFGAGLLVRWLKPSDGGLEEISRAYTNAVLEGGEEEEVRRWLGPPDSAVFAEVSCFVLGGRGVFDRLYFSSQAPPWAADDEPAEPVAEVEGAADGVPAASPRAARPVLPLELVVSTKTGSSPPSSGDSGLPLQATLRENGTLASIRRGRLPPVQAMWPGLPPDGDPLLIGPRLACEPFPSASKSAVRLSCQVPDFKEGAWYALEIQAQREGGEIACRYRYRKPAGGVVPGTLSVYVQLTSEDTPWTAFGERSVVELEPGGGASDPVHELVVGHGAEQVVLHFEPAVSLDRVEGRADRRQPVLVGSVAPSGDRGHDLEVTLLRSSRQEETAVRGLISQARGLHRDGELARANALLRSVIETYPWRKDDVRSVEEILEEWSREGETALRQVETDLQLLEATPSAVVHENLMASGQKLLERHAGTEVARRIAERLEKAREFWEEYQAGNRAREVKAQFDRGTDYYSRNEIHLAEFFLREVQKVARDPEILRLVEQRLALIEKRKEGKAKFGQ